MIQELVNKILEANKAYRTGNSIISDKEYDILVDELRELDPHNSILDKVGVEVKDPSRKRKLPFRMASMNKVKSIDDLINWSRVKGVSQDELIVITPKYDGLSLCVDEENHQATTRGDGFEGQSSDLHYQLIGNKSQTPILEYTYGEVMMSKKTFLDKYSIDYANPRNLVAGLLNSKDPTDILKDTVYIKYGIVGSEHKTKSDILDELNNGQDVNVPYKLLKISDISEEYLHNLFTEYSTDYEIDGLILEINNIELQEELGREKSSGNPHFAVAFKSPHFEAVAKTQVIGVSWNISKNGALRPTIHINPVKLDGVTISNVTGNNARFVKDLGIGIGAEVLVKRSGMVIPIIHEVLVGVNFQMPDVENIEWDKRGIDIVTKEVTEEQKFKQIVAFFEILEADSIGEGNLKILWNNGYKSISDILNLDKNNLMDIDGFGSRKSEIILNSIKKSTTNVSLSKIQHASNCFVGLGSRKLELLEKFGYENKPSKEDVLKVDGFAEISVLSYLEGFDRFIDFIRDLPVTILENKKPEKISSEFDGKSFCFTGIRRNDLESIIESKGGKISSGVSKNLTYLVAKDISSGSSKLTKAQGLGITLLSIDDLEKMINQ